MIYYVRYSKYGISHIDYVKPDKLAQVKFNLLQCGYVIQHIEEIDRTEEQAKEYGINVI